MTTTKRPDYCQIRHDYYRCSCDGRFPHAPGWEADVQVYAPVSDPAAFDHVDRLNEDGTVTLRMTPSAWHAYNMSPDTYQSFTGDSWVENELDYFNNEGSLSVFGEQYEALAAEVDRLGTTLEWDHFDWKYDHPAIVKALAEELTNWMGEILFDAGLESASVELLDSWSPAYYNFTSDGFEVSVTCDPAELRGLSLDFDVDDWADKHYRSYDGFASFVTSRMDDTDWHAEYDGGFRVESLLAAYESERDWVIRLAEAESEIYMENVTVTPDVDKIREAIGYEESGFTLTELEEWAQDCMNVYRAGMEPLPIAV